MRRTEAAAGFLGLALLAPGQTGAQQQTAAEQAEPTGLYKQAGGALAVESFPRIVLRDEKRNKDLQVRASFPREGGKYPLVVWSHGMYGSKDGYAPLVRHWVSHGYVVIQPTHSDSLSLDSAENRRKALAELKVDRVQDWANRPRDVQFVLDSLDELAAQAPGLAERMDRRRIGVGGHSYGAFTTQLLAGTTTRLLGRRQSFADPRPAAFVVISGNGLGPLFDKDSFQHVKRPTLFISGTHDKGRQGEGAQWRRHAFQYAAPGDKHLVWVEEAYHDFGGISGSPALSRLRAGERMGGVNPRHVDLVRSATLAFWDACLRDDPAARQYLANREIEKAGGVSLSAR